MSVLISTSPKSKSDKIFCIETHDFISRVTFNLLFRYFYKDLVRTYNVNCEQMDTKTQIVDVSIFGWEQYIATLVVWFIVYFCLWKGVSSSSYVVWVTVPLPIFFIVVMVMNGLTLENADQGIRMYLKGYDADGNEPDIGALLARPAMWADACG